MPFWGWLHNPDLAKIDIRSCLALDWRGHILEIVVFADYKI